MLLGVRSKRLYRLLGEPVGGSSEWLELESDSEALMRGPCMDASLYQSSVQVVGDASSSEGAEASSAKGFVTYAAWERPSPLCFAPDRAP